LKFFQLLFGKDLIKKGSSIKEVLDSVDEKIIELGGGIAFPAQISINEVAAHFCPEEDDSSVFGDDVVKLDVGVEFNGAIGDNALTVDLTGNNLELVKASRNALNAAVSLIKPGVTFGEIGKVVSSEIVKLGFVPISNLSGHGLDYYTIHCKPTVPNYDNSDPTIVEEGMVFAIEPFASTGKGRIYESGNATLFMQTTKKPVRNPFERILLKDIEEFKGMPFTTRWLTKNHPASKVKFTLKMLERQGIIQSFPPLPDMEGGLVSQAEHTILVTKDGCEVLTKF